MADGTAARERRARFLCDVMLGALARRLRALGHDAAYDHRADDPALLRRAARERRILVTRDTRLGPPPRGVRLTLLRANDTAAQLRELVAALGIVRHPGLLTRCTVCNARLRRATPEQVDRVPDHVRATHSDFRACPGCGRVYWPGTHRRGILDALERALPELRGPGAGAQAAPSALSSAAARGARAGAAPAPPPRRRPTSRRPP